MSKGFDGTNKLSNMRQLMTEPVVSESTIEELKITVVGVWSLKQLRAGKHGVGSTREAQKYHCRCVDSLTVKSGRHRGKCCEMENYSRRSGIFMRSRYNCSVEVARVELQ